MADMMWRVAKHEGLGNIVMEQVPIPDLGPNEALVRVHRSLISRGSELWRRYVMPGPVDPGSMGYSTAGVIEKVGSEVSGFAPGDRVSCTAPHAEYAIGDAMSAIRRRVSPLPDDVPFVDGTFQPLVSSSLGWTAAAGIQPHHTVVILGLGLVGNLVMQAATRFMPAQLCGIDMLPIRRRLAAERNMGIIIDGAARDPVESVLERTNGDGADIVIDCVGGRAGVQVVCASARYARFRRLAADYRSLPRRPAAVGRRQDAAQASNWGLSTGYRHERHSPRGNGGALQRTRARSAARYPSLPRQPGEGSL